MIEFLPPRDGAFGDRDAADFVGVDDGGADWGDEPPRSRWGTLIAATTVVGLLAAGVIAAAPWDDAADEATPPTTIEPSPITTTAGRTGDPGEVDVAERLDPSVSGWLLDPPVIGQQLVSLVDPGEDIGTFADGWAEVWATPDATRTSGRWLSLTIEPMGTAGGEVFDRVGPGWFPVDEGGRPGRAGVDRDGVVRLAVARTTAQGAMLLLSIDGFGYGLPQMLELAGTMAVDDWRSGDERLVLDQTGLLTGLEPIAAERAVIDLVDGVLIGPSPGGGAFYVGPDPADVTLLRERPTGSVDPRLAALTVSPGLDGTVPWAFFDGFNPELYEAGERIIDGIEVRVARFVTGESDVWLLTTLASGVLPAMLDDVRRVSAEEWAAAHARTDQVRNPVDLGPDSPPISIGGGALPDGSVWSATISAERGELNLVLSGTELDLRPIASLIGTDRMGAIGTVAIDDSMIVVAASAIDGAELRVRWADGTSIRTPLGEPLASDEPPTEPGRLDESFWTSWEGTRMLAVLANPATAGSPFTAEIVAPDGTVLAGLDPWSLGSAS